MAATASKRRAPARSQAPAGRAARGAKTSVARRAAPRAAKAVVSHRSPRHLALAAIRAAGRRAVAGGGEHLSEGASLALRQGRELVLRRMEQRPPIQVSVDVAVPLSVAWSEWMAFEAFTEGVRRIEDIERRRDRLIGRATGGGGGTEWEAEIVDEREREAFAWRSLEGTDCAGLITFHRLSDRLTRMELDLDVRPVRPADAFRLALPLARRRAENELRRFKARVEFINPDVYEADRNGTGGQRSGRDNSKGGDT